MDQQNRELVELQTGLPDAPDRTAAWWQAVLALGPFLLLPLVFLVAKILQVLLKTPDFPQIGNGFTLGLIGGMLMVLLVGIVKSFPRWCFPYWGFVLLIGLYLHTFTGTIMGDDFTGSWRVWIPLWAVVALGLLWTRSLQPMVRLLRVIWEDWTLLSFTFYGALPLLMIAVYDEVHDADLVKIVIMLILGAGALGYMGRSKIWQRFVSLAAGFSLAWGVAMIHQALYWNGRQEPGMGEPGNWVDTLKGMSYGGAALMLILLSPVLIEGLRWVRRSLRTPRTA
jgi:hypothetical protein